MKITKANHTIKAGTLADYIVEGSYPCCGNSFHFRVWRTSKPASSDFPAESGKHLCPKCSLEATMADTIPTGYSLSLHGHQLVHAKI